MTVRVLLIGDAGRAEMRPIMAWLEQRTTSETRRQFTTVAEYVAQRRLEWLPDMIVVLESHPDEYSSDDVAAFFAAAPISRIVCCAGAWSESAGRTRNIWPLAMRVAAVSAISRLEQEWKLVSNETAVACLPTTASREERFAVHHPAISSAASRNRSRVAVVSPDPAYRQMLVDLLTATGDAVSVEDDGTVDVLLWDADPWSSCRAEEVQHRLAFVPERPIIAVSGWVTPELEAELLSAGVRAVLPKLGDHNRLIEFLHPL